MFVPANTVARLAATASMAALAMSPVAAVPSSAVTPAAPAAAAASNAVTRRADVDGDGRPDRITLSLHSVRNYHPRYRLTVRTATGRTMTTMVYHWTEFDPWPAKHVFLGTAPVDGIRGNEMLFDVSADGDDETYIVYTVRGGRLQLATSPNAPRRADWDVYGAYLGVARGYTFGHVGRNRAVTHHALQLQNGRYVGRSTTYVWSAKGWKKRSSKAVDVAESAGKLYAGWHGISWR